MLKKISLKTILPLIISIVGAIIFFLSYNQYLLDKSLANLKISLKTLETVEQLDETKKIKDILYESFLTEMTSKDLDIASLSKVEFSNQLVDQISQSSQLEDLKSLLADTIKAKEKKRNPLFVMLDNLFIRLNPQKREESARSLKTAIAQLERKLYLYQGSQLQEKHLEIARLYTRLKDWDRAFEHLKNTISIDSRSQPAITAKMYAGLIHKTRGNYSRAQEIFSEIQEELPQDLRSFSLYQEGDSLYRMGKAEDAAKVFKEVFEQQPDSELNQLSQLRVGYTYLYDIGDEQKAFDAFTKLQELAPEARWNVHVDDNILPVTAEKSKEECFELLEEGYQLSEEAKEAEAEVKYSEALEQCEAAEKYCPPERNDVVVYSIAKKYREVGYRFLEEAYRLTQRGKDEDAEVRYVNALKQFESAIRFYPLEALSYSGKGLALSFLANDEEAVKEAAKAVKIAPTNAAALANLGFVYYRMGLLDEAISEYVKATMVSPESALLQYNLGTLYTVRGNLSKAIFHLEKTTQLNPQFAYAYNNLGYILWLKLDYKRAKIQLNRAIGLRSGYIDAHYNLGVVLFSLGKYEESRREFYIVHRLQPNYKRTNLYLTEIKKLVGH
ncbi:MAG: tetratricopeptide repeat protein [Candidatus Omnitrophota bacterium]|nr:MAG: tetratricopeptide repeat protein [Candidatus Omnitrophota bacterium]